MKLSTLTKDRIKHQRSKPKGEDDEPERKRGRNPVAHNVRSGLNKSVTMKDRKRALKRGDRKHRSKVFETLNRLLKLK